MKSFYSLITVFLVFALTICASVEASAGSTRVDYHRITSIMDDGRYVALDDGSLWRVPLYLSEQNSVVVKPYQERILLWGEGAMVKVLKRVGMHPTEEAFGLWNSDAPAARAYVVATLVEAPNAPDLILFVTSIEDGGRSIGLSDGSDWKVSWWQSWWSCNWKEGDSVVHAYEFFDDRTPSFLINETCELTWVSATPL